MAEGLINAAFDASSMSTITNLAQFSPYLNTQMGAAMSQIGDLLVQSAVANTWVAFANPTGQLADSIGYVLNSPMEVIVTVAVPYGWRMERGFVGADSLGRVYDEAGKPYAEPALTANEDQIIAMMSMAAAEAFAQMGEGR